MVSNAELVIFECTRSEHIKKTERIDEIFPGHDRGDDGGGSADAGRAGAGEEEAGAEGREGQIHLEEAMIAQ